MANLSIVIPYYKEPYLEKTIQSLKDNATGSIEILAMEGSKGMRAALNAGFAQATGDYLMKMDAHCAVSKGFDQILIADCAENWLMIPRRYSLKETTWDRDRSWPVRDYHYLSFPEAAQKSYGYAFQVANWPKKNNLEIDDTMAFQGSCWLANRKYFMDHVGFLDDRPETYGSFTQDQQEVGLKYWLGDGEVKVSKKTWYAHLQKRGYHYGSGVFSHRYKKNSQVIKSNEWATTHWMNNEEPGMDHKFEWLVNKFWPIPTWPEDWREKWQQT